MVDVEKRPVLTGLVALVAVALVVGLVAGFAVLAGTRIVGLGGGATTASDDGSPTSGETLDLPEPTPTEQPSAPLVTLLPGGGDAEESAQDGSGEKSGAKGRSKKKSKEEPDKSVISLSAGQLSVGPMERIDLTGTFPGGEGAVLQVQRLEGGTWEDFPVTVSVSNGTFATYVQSGDPGPNQFRVKDSDSPRTSNPVKVQVG